MKKVTGYFVVAVLGLAASVSYAKSLPLGATAPSADVKMLSVDGSAHTIGGARGPHGTLVVFSCNACPWAKAWEERITTIGNAYQKKGYGVIVINSNDPGRVPEDGMEPMKERAKKLGLEFPYVVDATSGVARAFGATRTPEVFLFDAKGKLVYHGAVDDNARSPGEVDATYLTDALDALMAGEPVPVTETKAIGCSIKFRSDT